jgi:TrmH family RNA methyltransferase
VTEIGSKHPSIQKLRRLSGRRSARRDDGAYVIDGPMLLAEALDAGIEVREVLVEPSGQGPAVEQARDAGIVVRSVAEGLLATATSTVTSQGVAAIAAVHDRPPSAVIAAMGPLALVLVGVADPGNAGTLVRAAEASGAGAVLFCDGSVDPFNPKCVRASAGSLFHVAVASGGDAVRVLDELGSAGARRLATVARGGTPYHDADLTGPVALVLGNEAHGLPDGLDERLDERITIPMAGKAESLNVGMAGAIVCFEALRQRSATP